jgi:peroxiredoxin Q/BCP
MKRWIGILSAGAATAMLTVGAWAQQPVPNQGDLKVGDLAPDFTLQASDGQTYALSKLRGKTVVLAWFPKAFTGG